jgi:excisionase family DNA binding protein
MAGHIAPTYAADRLDPERLLTIADVAYRLAISRDTVYRLVRSGALAPLRVGDRLRFRVSDLEAYLERDTGP